MRLAATILGLAGCVGAGTFSGKVVAVADGDSISVLRNGRPTPVRLNGIDAPERGQPYSAAAKRYLSDLVFGQIVRVELKTKDRYGRDVAEVFLPDGRHVNREMVRAGYAWWFRRYAPRDARLEALEAEAHDGRRGLWQDADPVPPWEYRRRR
jgi:endonuclease YncB( thermonuclease family)